jgi:ABC-type multidrug transport system permease subunit
VIVALLLTSIGIGFLIAELSSSTTQAVQMAMGVLLASVFFSGFVLSTQFFVGVGKLVGLLLPATYAIQAMRDVMLRGEILRTSPYIVLPAAAAMLFIVNWALLRREAGKPALPALVSGVGEGTVSVVRTSGRTIERALRWGRRSGSHRPRDEA